MSSSTDVDSRGVQRGACSMCSCDQYNGGTEGKKCVDCGHPPVKHRNALTGSVAPTPRPASAQLTTPATAGSISQPPTLDSGDEVAVDTNGSCQFPGCSKQTLFDPNTGTQDKFCSDHIGVSPNITSLSLSNPLQTISMPSFFRSIKSRRVGRGPPKPPKPRRSATSPAQRIPFATVRPTVTPPPPAPPTSSVPPDQQCKLSGCSRRRFTERFGYTHDFCGKRHAMEYEKQNSQVPPELQCKTPGCYKQRYQNPSGGYFDYCSRYCRDNGGKPMLESASTPNMALTSHGTCHFPGCTRPKYCDPANNRVHDWCGRNHAYQARIQGIGGGDAMNIRVATSQEKSVVVGKFTKAWASGKGQCPPVSFVFIITNTKLTQRWSAYRSTLQKQDVGEYYHGTTITCNISVNSSLCNDPNCGICGISSTGFDRRCIQKNINFQRFGHGFYLAPNSSKCHDYTQGSYTYRAMLLVDVCPGNKYNLKKGDQTLKGPPQGFDSVYGQAGVHLNYEELVVYNPDAALPKCIIVYQRDREGKIAK